MFVTSQLPVRPDVVRLTAVIRSDIRRNTGNRYLDVHTGLLRDYIGADSAGCRRIAGADREKQRAANGQSIHRAERITVGARLTRATAASSGMSARRCRSCITRFPEKFGHR